MKKITLLFFTMIAVAFTSQISAQSLVIGTGTAETTSTGSDPIDGYFNSFRYQVVYTAAELSAMMTPYDEITALGWSISGDYAGGALLGYTIKIGHTSAVNSAAHDASPTMVVKNPFDYDPTVTDAGTFDMITFDTNFVWNGVDNILIEVCSDGQNPFTSPYGQVRGTTMANGSRRYRTDGGTSCGVNTDTTNGDRPNIQLNYVDGTPPSCLPPSNVVASAITTTSATIDWTAGDTESAWEYALLPAGSPEPTSGTGIGSPTYMATLTASTAYDFYVRADCTGGDYSTWSMISFSSADETPDCATNPFPADGATDVFVGDLTFTWSAPATGPTPTSYDLYVVDNAAGDNPALIGNYTTTSADLAINVYGTTIYWLVIPINNTAEASGCSVWSFTTQTPPGYCFAAPNGRYPSAAFTPGTCDGTTANNITTIAWAGEYSVVNVVNGQTYQFTSSVATDFLTISDAGGTTPLVFGTTPVTWTSDIDGEVRFYTHLDDQCTPENVSRTRGVLCGPTLGISEESVNSFTYFPNPVKNTLNLNAQSNIQNVSIYNMLGQEVLRSAPNTLNSEVNMASLQTGAYFVKVTINDATETIRVIKQ